MNCGVLTGDVSSKKGQLAREGPGSGIDGATLSIFYIVTNHKFLANLCQCQL